MGTLSFERQGVRVFVQYPVIFTGAPFLEEGVVRNLSVSGCQIECPRTALVGSYVKLRLPLFDQSPSLEVELAVIRWVQGWRFGVEFIRMPDEEQRRLRHFLGSHLIQETSLIGESSQLQGHRLPNKTHRPS